MQPFRAADYLTSRRSAATKKPPGAQQPPNSREQGRQASGSRRARSRRRTPAIPRLFDAPTGKTPAAGFCFGASLNYRDSL